MGCVAVYCHAPHTRARAHSRALTFRTRLSLRRTVWGAAQHTSRAASPSPDVLARAHTATRGATSVRLSVPDTLPLHLRPGSRVRHTQRQLATPGWSEAHTQIQSPSLS